MRVCLFIAFCCSLTYRSTEYYSACAIGGQRVQMIRAMHDSRRRIGRFAQDDLRKNRDDSRTELVVFGAFIVLST